MSERPELLIGPARWIAENEALKAALKGLIKLQEETEMTTGAAYDAMFKGAGRDAWDKARAAIAQAGG